MRGQMMRDIQPWLALLLCAGGLGLLFCAFFAPPEGTIDASVLVAYGEVMTFAGAILGIEYHYRKQE